MEKIKLVIWDLDETFWKGTLSEEGVVPIEANIQLVKELTDRGIINSIVSKNDFHSAKKKLIELGIWEYFVFPAIDWAPKGNLIKNIIDRCQLRAVNVLFLDDNHLNLKEATFYNPNLHAHFPSFIKELPNHKALVGKEDKNHSRLKQYKILEQKAAAQQNFSSNTEFLKSSNIQIAFIQNLEEYHERIVELLERTNQLNFTKIRSNSEEVTALLNDTNNDTAIIRVKDNFGDYGIVGFYSLNRTTQHLDHFVFSCRILNLGVAQYVYAKLNFPTLHLVPEIAEQLDHSSPDWIIEFSNNDSDQKGLAQKIKPKIFFKGGCDLGQMIFYLKNNNFEIEEETNYVSKEGFPIHQEHTQVLLDSLNLSDENKTFIVNHKAIPFTDPNFYQTNVFDSKYDCLVYSVLMDYAQEVYEHKQLKIKLPFGGDDNYWTDEGKHQDILLKLKAKGYSNVNQSMLTNFSKDFIHLGQIHPEDFLHNLQQIRKSIPIEIPIVLINGAEIQASKSLEKKSLERHQIMNKALIQFIDETENVFLLDIRKVVTHPSQLTDSIRHYNRETYRNISLELLNILDHILDTKVNTSLSLKTKVVDQFRSFTKVITAIKKQIIP